MLHEPLTHYQAQLDATWRKKQVAEKAATPSRERLLSESRLERGKTQQNEYNPGFISTQERRSVSQSAVTKINNPWI